MSIGYIFSIDMPTNDVIQDVTPFTLFGLLFLNFENNSPNLISDGHPHQKMNPPLQFWQGRL